MIHQARARQTGRPVEWGRAADFGMRDDDGKWCTLCVEHSEIVHHARMVDARSWAAEPRTWCEACRVAAPEATPEPQESDEAD